MSEWIFPEKLPCFNPVGTRFEKVFEDPIALIAYAQYRRKHIVSDVQNEWLPRFALDFAQRIAQKKERDRQMNKQELLPEEAVKIWTQVWATGYMQARDEADDQKWRQFIEAILPYLNGDWKLRLVQEGDKFFLLTEKETTR